MTCSEICLADADLVSLDRGGGSQAIFGLGAYWCEIPLLVPHWPLIIPLDGGGESIHL